MKQEIIDIIRKFHLTNEIKTYDQCADEILRLFSVSNNEVAVCSHPDDEVWDYNGKLWCDKCGNWIKKQTEC